MRSANSKKLSVLVSAHEFSPDQGSECAVGWNICTRLAAYHHVTVLAASGSPHNPVAYKKAFSRYSKKHGRIPGLKVVFVDQPPSALRYAHWNRKLFDVSDGLGFRPLFYAGLNNWHREAFRKAVETGVDNFDVVHQLTPIGFRSPGYLWKLKKPFFWGPIGGAYNVPLTFSRSLGIKPFFFETARTFFNAWQAWSSYKVRKAASKAQLVWTVTKNEERLVNRLAGDKSAPMIEIGTTPCPTNDLLRSNQETLRLCWSGRHDASKALPILLYALKNVSNCRLDVLGEGPCTKVWQALAERLNLKEITWHGNVPHYKALDIMRQANVFVHTSIREATGSVVLEALGFGIPVVCHEACGMATAINNNCGIKVPLFDPTLSVAGFSNALNKIVEDRDLLARLSAGALKRSFELSWDEKAKRIAEGYWKAVHF